MESVFHYQCNPLLQISTITCDISIEHGVHSFVFSLLLVIIMDISLALLQYSSSTLRSSCLTAGVVCEQQEKLETHR